MKWQSYILAFWVVFLTVQPTIAFANSQQESECCGSCCENESSNQKKDQPTKNDCKDQNCNPFQSCGCCLGFTVRTSLLKIEAPELQKSILTITKENSISHYSPDVWQPPKIS